MKVQKVPRTMSCHFLTLSHTCSYFHTPSSTFPTFFYLLIPSLPSSTFSPFSTKIIQTHKKHIQKQLNIMNNFETYFKQYITYKKY